MTTRVSYKSIDLKSPVRVFQGRAKVTSVEAIQGGARIYRVFGDGLDFFQVEGGTAIPGVEIESSNVAAGVRSPLPVVTGRGGKSKKGGKDVDPDDLADYDDNSGAGA